MNRRELLKAIPAVAAIPITIGGTKAKAIEVESGKKYIVLVDRRSPIDVEDFAKGCGHIGMTGMVYAVDDVDSDIRMYKVD